MVVKKIKRVLAKLRLKAALCRRIWVSFDEDHRRRGIEVSYSQCGEDILSLYALRVLGIDVPSYLDIGANHPYRFSNTYLMYLLGGRGINIEPDPEAADFIRRVRPDDTTITAGVAKKTGEMDFFLMTTNVANTFIRAEAEELQKRDGNLIKRVVRVPVYNIRTLLAERGFMPDFLSLDVEGMDLEILESMDWVDCRPKVICVETIDYFSQKKRPEIVQFLGKQGYTVHADTFINTIFVDAKSKLKK